MSFSLFPQNYFSIFATTIDGIEYLYDYCDEMFKCFKEILRDYKKDSIMKRFSNFSRFVSDSRSDDFRELGLYLKSIQLFGYKEDTLDKVLRKFNCIDIEDGWHIGKLLLFKDKKAKYPILYCYKGKVPNDWTSQEELYKNGLLNSYDIRIKDNPQSIYHHIMVESSVMGAWQVYLLESYPFIDLHVKSEKTCKEEGLVFSYADIRIINRKLGLDIPDEYDLRPYVWMKDNVAYVTCCKWYNNVGLYRDVYTIVFDGNRVKDIIINHEMLDYAGCRL